MQPTEDKTLRLVYVEALEQYQAARDQLINRRANTSDAEYLKLLSALEKASVYCHEARQDLEKQRINMRASACSAQD
jgi:hypothetical protein